MPLPDFLPGVFALTRGRPSDYFAMEHFHYLPQRPATYADVWVVRYHEPPDLPHEALHFADCDAMESRWRRAARHDDGPESSRAVAVGVLSYPTIRSAPRERTLALRDMAPRERIVFVNAHVRTVSRVVVHPQFRGLGLASELVGKLIKVCTTRYVEASAVMAHVHPFFAAAGMRQIECEHHGDDGVRPAYFIFDKKKNSLCGPDRAK